MLALLLGAALFSAGLNQASAAIILEPVTVGAAEGTNFRYTYNVFLSQDAVLLPPGAIQGDNAPGSPVGGQGDGFTYYDAFGLVAGSAAVTGVLALPGNSAISVQNVGVDWPGTDPLPPDNPAAPNITVRWLGGASPEVIGPALLGQLTFLSTNPFVPADPFADHATAGASQDAVNRELISNNVEQVPGPASQVPPQEIPEPASLVILACGAPILLALARRRRRQEAQ